MSPTIIKLTWDDYERAIRGMVTFLRESGRAPDLIVGLARGGLVPMATLSHRLGVRAVGIVLMDKTASDARFANDNQKIVRIDGSVFRWDDDAPPREILVVDDIVAYGDTLRAAHRLVRERFGDAPRITTVSICLRGFDWGAKTGTDADPGSLVDYHAVKNPGDSWIEFPWE